MMIGLKIFIKLFHAYKYFYHDSFPPKNTNPSHLFTKEQGKNFNLYDSVNVCAKMFLIINV